MLNRPRQVQALTVLFALTIGMSWLVLLVGCRTPCFTACPVDACPGSSISQTLFDWSATRADIGKHNGLSIHDAVHIRGARTEVMVLYAIAKWFDVAYPGALISPEGTEAANGREYVRYAVQLVNDEFETVYFDPDSGGLPFRGRWTFVSTNGKIIHGTIDAAFRYKRSYDPEAWADRIGERSGVLRFQYEDVLSLTPRLAGAVTSSDKLEVVGLMAAGPLFRGRKHGKWTFTNPHGFVTVAQFKSGRKHGLQVDWLPDGSKLSESLWDEGTLEKQMPSPTLLQGNKTILEK